MKRPKKLTREKKCIVSSYQLSVYDWMLVDETDNFIIVINKRGGELRKLEKSLKG